MPRSRSARLRLAALAALAVAGLFLGLNRGLTWLLLHEAGIHRVALGLDTGEQDRGRPSSLPFQRLSQTLLWENQPNYFVPGTDPPRRLTNSLGCQGPELTEPKSALRVLLLGDSSTFGLGVGQDQTFGALLGPLLRERLGRPVEVVNAGVVGYTSAQGLEQLRQLGPLVQPDFVVEAFGLDERWLHRTGDRAALAAGRRQSVLRTLYRSEAFLLLRYVLLSLRPPPGAAESNFRPRLFPDEFEESLVRLAELTRQLGARPILMTLAENPGITLPILEAQAQLEAGNPAAAARTLRSVVHSRWHRYPLIDELCAKTVAALPAAEVPPEVAQRAALASNKNWGRVFDEPRYLDAAGRVASRAQAPLVRFPPWPEGHFYADDIHPSPEGHRWIAEQLTGIILAEPR